MSRVAADVSPLHLHEINVRADSRRLLRRENSSRLRRPILKRWSLPALVLGLSILICPGYTCLQVGVDSNFLIDNSRVLFAQSDGSLTALALDTGEVLARHTIRNHAGTLRRIPQGILVLGKQNIALLNPTNLSVLWETTAHCEPNVTTAALISCDETGLVQYRDLANGSVRWSYRLPGTLQVVAESGKVLALRAATYEEGLAPTIALLNLQDGKELFRGSPTNGVRWADAFFDGTNVYVESGAIQVKQTDFEPERLAVWSANGERTQSLPIPAGLRQTVRDGKPFELDGRTFWKGHVYADRQSLPFGSRGLPVATAERTNDASRTFESDYDLGGGLRFIERAKSLGGTNDLSSTFVMEIEVRTPTNGWAGVLPYLLDRGRITAVGKAAGKILIGTDFGQVECIDAGTGESKWLYYFPTLRRTISYSSRGLPPTESEAAATFHRENGSPPISGLHVINGKAGKPRIIPDLSPVDPYRQLPYHLAIAWSAAGITLGVMVLVHFIGWLRKWTSIAPGTTAVWLTFLVFCCYLFYGRVSPESSLALKIAILAGFIFGVWDAIKSCRRGLWGEGIILLITFAGIGLFILLALI